MSSYESDLSSFLIVQKVVLPKLRSEVFHPKKSLAMLILRSVMASYLLALLARSLAEPGSVRVPTTNLQKEKKEGQYFSSPSHIFD